MLGHARRSKVMNLKQLAGEYAANFVNDGMKI
ncbi:ribose 5-phosphate isomerase A, partial [Bacillus cereus]|nr:ribose 5-phosphate isomerase A [Bacillus cereus]